MLETHAEYVELFCSTAFWEPHVTRVCTTHALQPCAPVCSGQPGTYPTFIAAGRWVVKFFGRLFQGEQAHRVEQECARLLRAAPELPVPALLASGNLFDSEKDWPWPYLVYEYLPGLSLRDAETLLPAGQMENLAVWMGETLQVLHRLPLKDSPLFSSGWEAYFELLQQQANTCGQRHREWGSLPPHLVEQIDRYLLPVENLIVPGEQPRLLHADLTRDHLLLAQEEGLWAPQGLIDFGDALAGSLYYELAALHLDLFAGERALLGAFLRGYGGAARQDPLFGRKALSTALLHRFNVLASASLPRADSLEELENHFWNLTTTLQED